MPDRRYRGQRRWGLDIEFPLIDNHSVTVICDRRHMSERRLENITLEERLTLFSEMPHSDPEHNKKH
jgi:hypothetical protein